MLNYTLRQVFQSVGGIIRANHKGGCAKMTEKQKELLKAIREQPNPEEVLDILIAIVERKLQKKLGEE